MLICDQFPGAGGPQKLHVLDRHGAQRQPRLFLPQVTVSLARATLNPELRVQGSAVGTEEDMRLAYALQERAAGDGLVIGMGHYDERASQQRGKGFHWFF